MKKTYLRFSMLIAVFLTVSMVLSSCSLTDRLTNKNTEEPVYYGTAEAEQLDICTEIAGRVKEIKVEEGQRVKAGDIIAILDIPENAIREDQSQLSIESSKNELEKVQKGSRKEEIKAQEALVKQAEAAVRQAKILVKQQEVNVNSAQTAYDYKEKLYTDIKKLYDSGKAAKSDLDNAKFALDSAAYALDNAKYTRENAQAQLEGLQSQLEAAREKLNLLKNGATQEVKNSAQYGVKQAEKSNELLQLAIGKGTIVASTDGVVQSVNFSIGEYVTPGSPVVTLINTEKMWVRVFVPEKELPNLKLDKEVTIKSDFIKDKAIKGKISYISAEAEFTPMNIVTKKDRMKLVYEVKVKLTEGYEAVKPGMLLDVDVEQKVK